MLKIQTRLILIILFLLPIYLIKIKFGWVSFNALELLISLLFVVWAFNREKKYPATAGPRQGGGFLLSTQYFILVILIFTGLLLSVIANKNYYIGLGAIKGWFVFPIIFGIIFYDALKKDESLLGKALLALFCSGVAVSVTGALYKLSGFLTYDGRLRIFYDSPNQLAMFLAIPFLIGICLIVPRLNLGGAPRFSLGLGILLITTNLYLTKSYGAWLAIATALIVIFWLKYSEIKQNKYFLIFLIILIIFLGWVSFNKYKNIENFDGRSSLDSRVMIWRSAGLMIKNNPLFGIGPGNFQNKYLEYQKYFPPYLEWAVPQPHNLFLAFWLEAGFIGLVGFVLLLVQFFKDNKKAIENNRLYGTLCLTIILYFLIHGLVDTTYWRNDMAVVFWVVVAMNLFLATGKDYYDL